MTNKPPAPGYLPDDLLSIDINAQIKKIASNTFTSEAHYPVELVHSALNREADKIEIQFLRGKLVIRDNGKGIRLIEFKHLKTLFDPKKETATREKAIEYFLSNTGIGLLALFAVPWNRIIIDNFAESSSSRLIFNSTGLVKETKPGGGSGTTITILSNTLNWKPEEELIRKYCSRTKAEIRINGQRMEKASLLYHSMVRLEMNRDQNNLEGELSIPSTGEVCRILLLHRGIPWFHTSIHPWNGFIFQVAYESRAPLSPENLKKILPTLKTLYEYILAHYFKYPEKFRDRIDHLIFKHHLLTGSSQFLSRFRPFLLQNYSSLSFFDLRQLGRERKLFAVYRDQNNPKKIVLRDNILILTRRQTDFLVNQKKVKIHFLSHQKHPKERFMLMIQLLNTRIKTFLSRIFFRSISLLTRLELSEEEKIFLRLLNKHLSEISYLGELNPESRVIPTLIRGRGVIPVFLESDPPGLMVKNQLRLYLRRNHPVVKEAVSAVQKDSDNIVLLTPFLPEDLA